jgi:hypothetical protein
MQRILVASKFLLLSLSSLPWSPPLFFDHFTEIGLRLHLPDIQHQSSQTLLFIVLLPFLAILSWNGIS